MLKIIKKIMRGANGKLPLRYRIRRLRKFSYCPNPDLKNFIFICGLHRSGTTLLENLLSSSFDVSYLRISVSESEGQHAQSVYSPALKFGGPGNFAFSSEMQNELNLLSDYVRHRNDIIEDWSRFVVGRSNTIIEKSPPNLTKIWWLRKVFPNSKFIVITRDPRATAVATQKWSRTSHTKLMEHWHSAYLQARTDWDERDTFHVKYEDICSDPALTMNKIESFLGMPLLEKQNSVDTRFAKITNSNSKYLEVFEGEVRMDGVWNEFGYEAL